MRAMARRLNMVEVSLGPKPQVLRWLDEMFGFGSEEAYAAWLVDQPIGCLPRVKIAEAVEGAVREAMRGAPKETIQGAVRNAVRDVYFLTKLVIDLIALVDEKVALFELHAALCARELQLAMIHHLALELPTASRRLSGSRTAILDLRDHLAAFVGAVCRTQQTVEIISRRYFDGHSVVFPAKASSLADAAERAEAVVAEYNGFVAAAAKRLGLGGPTKPARAHPGRADREGLRLDLTAIREAAAASAVTLACGHVGLAKADALWDIGRPEEAARLLRACNPWGARP